MESKLRTIITLRWIQWVLGAFSFGVCFAYFLADVNFYLWIPSILKAQVALTGILHIYLYLAAIWISVKPQGPLAWAILDIIAVILAAAAAGTGQSSISEYCTSSNLTLFWSDANFAFVPRDQLASSDESSQVMVLLRDYLQRACGLNIGVVVANAILVILFSVTTFLQIKQHREDKAEHERYMTHQEKMHQQTGWRKSLAAPFARRKMNLEA